MAYGYDQGWLSKSGSSLAPVSIPPRLETGAGDTGSGAAVTAIPHCAPNKLAPFKCTGVADGSPIIIAILQSSNPALVSVRGRTRAVGNRINGRAAAHQGMGAGRPAVIGQGGVEDVN
jgi:hypothetical protein